MTRELLISYSTRTLAHLNLEGVNTILKVAILGAGGLLGTNLCHYSSRNWEITRFERGSIRDFSSLDTGFFDDFDVVINCIGFTNVDLCEIEKENCNVTNTQIPAILANKIAGSRTKLVQISTDHFESRTFVPRSEITRVWGINEYGKSKLAAEELVLDSNPDALIVRTNFFGWGRKHRLSILDWMIKQLEQDLQLDAFEDILFTPISIFELFRLIEGLLEIKKFGIVNCSGSDSLSKYQFGKLVAEVFGLNSNLVVPISIDSKGLLALRPKYLSLDNALAQKSLGVNVPSLAEMLEKCASDRLWRDQINLMD